MITLCPRCSEGSKKTVEETKQALKDKEVELTQLKAELEKSKLVAEERRKVGIVPFGDSRPLYFQPALAIGVFTCPFLLRSLFFSFFSSLNAESINCWDEKQSK